MPIKSKSNRVKAHILAAYLLVPCAVLLMAFIPVADKPVIHTTPYAFGMPDYLFHILSPDSNAPTVEGVALGRRLFYDPILSGNQKQACAGCHKQELAFTDGLPISVGAQGHKARRNSMSLINLGWQNNYFWDRRAATLEDLIHFPLTDTLEMGASTTDIERRLNLDPNYKQLFRGAFGKDTITISLASQAISQFLRTIVSYNAPFDVIFRDYVNNGGDLNVKDAKIIDAALLINGLGPGSDTKYKHSPEQTAQIRDIGADTKVLTTFAVCLNCHYSSFQIFCFNCSDEDFPATAITQYRNNGLDSFGTDLGVYPVSKDSTEKYCFKVPSLRNIEFTGPYMHDGRFKTLEQVVDHYNTGILPNPNLDPLLKDKNNRPLRFDLSESEKKQLVKLIKLFSDKSVMTDQRFSSPFISR